MARKRRRDPHRHDSTAMMLFGTRPRTRMESPEQREQLALALRLSNLPEMKVLAEEALSPATELKSMSFAALIARNGLSAKEVAEEYKLIRKSEGYIRQANHIPDIMEQQAVAAMDREQQCPTCEGAGKVQIYNYELVDKARATVGEDSRLERPSDPRVLLMAEGFDRCDLCNGTGRVLIRANMDSVKLIFETFQLTGQKGGGPLVNLDMRKLAAGETMSDLAASVAGIVEGTASTRGEEGS